MPQICTQSPFPRMSMRFISAFPCSLMRFISAFSHMLMRSISAFPCSLMRFISAFSRMLMRFIFPSCQTGFCCPQICFCRTMFAMISIAAGACFVSAGRFFCDLNLHRHPLTACRYRFLYEWSYSLRSFSCPFRKLQCSLPYTYDSRSNAKK